jgi:perosamine synthetase
VADDTARTFYPYGRQSITEADITAVADTLRSDFLTTGPMVARFEGLLASHAGARFASVYNSGTSALHGMYAAAGVEAGDEIITSPLTFAATANAAHYLGARVRFVDVESDTGNLDPAGIAAAITPRTKLIVAVDFAGHPAEYDAIHDVAHAHGIRVVADAAHSLGASYRGRPVGSLCLATEVSLHPVKPITTAEGGAVLTDDEELHARSMRFRSHGMVRTPEHMLDYHGPWYMEQHELGFNYRLTDVQCALGVSQIGRLESFIERRQRIAELYTELLADVPGIELPCARSDVQSGWHLYVIRTRDAAHRRPLFERLRELQVGVQVHYLPVYMHPWYRQNGYADVQCPIAESIYWRSISIPVFPDLSHEDVHEIAHRIRRACAEVGV